MKKQLLFLTIVLFFGRVSGQAIINTFNHSTDQSDTYQSTCVGADGSFYAASAYGSSHDFQGELIELLNPDANQEVLVVKYLNDGTVDWKHRITITSNNATVGKIEFMAVDANGYLYLSTQGTTGNQFLKIEEDSLAISGAGNRVIQLYPNGKLRSLRSFNNQIHNLCTHGNHVYVNGLTNFNEPYIAKYDTLFTEPIWISQGSSAFYLGASAFDRLQMNCSPSGEYISFLSIDAGQNLSWGGNDIGQQTTQNFDELVAVVIDSTGAFQFAKTYLSTTGLSPLSIAVDDNANLFVGCYTTGVTNVAGIEYAPLSGYMSNHSLIIKVNNLGVEEWAVQCSATTSAPRFEGLNIDLDGNLLFAGSGGGALHINDEIVVSLSSEQPFAGKINQAGELQWVVGATEVENSCRFFRIYPLQENLYAVSAQSFFATTFQCSAEITGNFNHNHFIALIDALEALPITANPAFDANFLNVSFESNAVNGFSYLWEFGDGSSSTEINPTHLFAEAGTYSVTLTISNCQFEEEIILEVEVEEEVIQNVFENEKNNVYGFISEGKKLSLSGQFTGSLDIVDPLGRVVFSSNGNALSDISLDRLSSGVYLLLFRETGDSWSQKIFFP